MSKVVITGGSGLLATNWACCMREHHQIVLGLHNRKVTLRGVTSSVLNIESVGEINRWLDALKPDMVVHTAGLTNVDECERNPAAAHAQNCELSRNIAVACQQHGVRLLHISTDHLFDGSHAFYKESDTPIPLNVYARSKLDAEIEVAKVYPAALIVRTNFFGWGPLYRPSFSDWVIDSLRGGKQITLFDDVYFTPVLIDTLADASYRLSEAGASGVFNVVSGQRLSKFEFGNMLATEFRLPQNLLLRGRLSDAKLSAARPHDMSLDNSKVNQFLNMQIDALGEQVAQLKVQGGEGRAKEINNAIMEN
jgi:dTDP-4-dehydrorhamnose reductase